MRQETNHESTFAQCATARQVNTNKHESSESLKQCCSVRCSQRIKMSAVMGAARRTAHSTAATTNDTGVNLKSQSAPVEAEAKPALDSAVRCPAPLAMKARQPLRFSCSS